MRFQILVLKVGIITFLLGIRWVDASTSKAGRDISTFKGLIDEYIELYAKPKKTSWHEDLRVLNKDVLPKWKYLKADEITNRDVAKLLSQITVLGSNVATKRTLNILHSLFNFAVTRGILKSSPCVDIAEPDDRLAKDRVLKEDEIRKIWFGLEKAKMSEGTRLALKLLLVTGQRNGEVAGAKWKEFDLIDKWWTIAGERTKNKKKHRVFLTNMAVDILREAKKLSVSSKNSKKWNWVFPTSKEGHITSRSISAAIRNNSERIPKGHPKYKPPYGDFFNIGHFVPQDMRRTVANLMKELKVDELHIVKVQNYTTSGKPQKSIHIFDAEKRQTLEIWERKLQEILFSWRKPSKN